LRSIFQ